MVLKKIHLPLPQQPVVTWGTFKGTVVQTVVRGPETAPEWQGHSGRNTEKPREGHCASLQNFLQIGLWAHIRVA